jgi:hypothetical protein
MFEKLFFENERGVIYIPPEVTELAQNVGFCTCDETHEALEFLYQVLNLLGEENRDARLEELPKLFQENHGLMINYLYWLDRLELMEHGGWIVAGWRTQKADHFIEESMRLLDYFSKHPPKIPLLEGTFGT